MVVQRRESLQSEDHKSSYSGHSCRDTNSISAEAVLESMCGLYFGTEAPSTQPSEPILFPKLRIYFADFPYLLYSIDQRLLTLET